VTNSANYLSFRNKFFKGGGQFISRTVVIDFSNTDANILQAGSTVSTQNVDQGMRNGTRISSKCFNLRISKVARCLLKHKY
jgi:hypothetical protein